MDIERIVVRMGADATQYLRVFDVVEARLVAFGAFLTGELLRSSMRLAMEFERMGIAFEVMTGSAEKGKKVLADIVDLAVRTPFTSQELVKSAKQAMAFGFEMGDIIPVISRLGDVSVATGSDMDRLILALGQVRTTGRLMGQELRQFTNAGVPILQYLAKAMGVAESAVPQMVRMGLVGFNDVAKAFNLMTNEGGRFFGMMERTNLETVFGRWQNFTESIQIFSRRVGEEIFKAFGVRDLLTEWTTALANVDLSKIGDVMKDIRDVMAAVWGVAKGVAKAISDWAAANPDIARLVVGVLALAAGFKLLFGVMSPLTAMGAAFFAPLIAVVGTAFALIKGLVLMVGGPLLSGLAAIAVAAVTPVGLVVSGFVVLGLAVMTVTGNLGKLAEGFKFVLSAAWEMGSGIAGLFADLFVGILEQAGRSLGRMVQAFTDLSDEWKLIFRGMMDAFSTGDTDLGFKLALAGMKAGIKTLAEWMKVEMGLAWTEIAIGMEYAFKKAFLRASVSFAIQVEKILAMLPGTTDNTRGLERGRDMALMALENDRLREVAGAAANAAREMDRLANILRTSPEITEARDLAARVGADRFLGPNLMDVLNRYGRAVAGGGIREMPEMEFSGAAASVIPMPLLQAQYQRLWFRMADSVSVLHRQQELRLRGESPGFGASIMGAARFQKATEDFKLFTEAVGASGAVARRAAAEIGQVFEVTAQTRAFLLDLSKDFQNGTNAFNTFRRELGMMEEAVVGPWRTRDRAAAAMALLGAPGVAANPTMAPPIPPGGQVETFGLFRMFDKLQKAVGRPEDRRPPAALEGSREAAEIIGRAQSQTLSVQEQIRSVLIQANEIYLRQEAYQRQVAQEMRTLIGAGSPAIPVPIPAGR